MQGAYDAMYAGSDFTHFRHEGTYIDFVCSFLAPTRDSARRALDVGCGTGHYTHLFAARGIRSFGIDISRAAITRAKQAAPTSAFCIGDCTQLPFRDDMFDLVFCHNLSLFNDPLDSSVAHRTQDLLRTLAPNGVFVLAHWSNLRGSNTGRKWRNHRLRDTGDFLRALNLRVNRLHFVERRFALRWFGRLCFTPLVSGISALGSIVSGHPGLIVGIARKPGPGSEVRQEARA